jgi:hypothetical protein
MAAHIEEGGKKGKGGANSRSCPPKGFLAVSSLRGRRLERRESRPLRGSILLVIRDTLLTRRSSR